MEVEVEVEHLIKGQIKMKSQLKFISRQTHTMEMP